MFENPSIIQLKIVKLWYHINLNRLMFVVESIKLTINTNSLIFFFLLLIKKIHKNLPPYFIPVYKNELSEYSKQYIIHQTTNKNVLISQMFVFDSTTKTLGVAWHLCCCVVFQTMLTMLSTLPTLPMIPMTTTTIGDRSLKV